jgi:hypothetical protein
MAIREQSESDDGGGEPSRRPAAAAGGPVARPTERPQTAPASGGARPPWSAPRLIRHGDVRALTLGGSTGVFESGQPGTFRP